MFTVYDLLKDGFLDDKLEKICREKLPCTEHEGETRPLCDPCDRLKPENLPVERGGTMDKVGEFVY